MYICISVHIAFYAKVGENILIRAYTTFMCVCMYDSIAVLVLVLMELANKTYWYVFKKNTTKCV